MDFSMAQPQPLGSPSTATNPRPVAKRLSQPSDQSKHAAPRRRHVQGTMEDRLANMPEIRPMPWRPGTEVPDELETGGESRRKQIRYGCLLATRGDIVAVPCKTCASGRGKFNVCVALEGFFKGACASCQLSGRPNRCTIKQQDEPKLNSDLVDHDTITPDQSEPYINSYQELPESHVPQIPQHDTIGVRAHYVDRYSESRDKTLNRPINHGESSYINDTTHTKRRRTDGPQWDKAAGISSPREQSREEPIEHPRISWAAVNLPAPAPLSQARKTSNGMEIHGQVYNNIDHEKREETAPNEESSGALIDTLPKNKQRQIYSLVSGLQGGIEHLQRELDMLKKTMGIDDAE